jgi:dephospho-CoA kinase
MADRAITIGLTGGIGTGKTTVAAMLEDLGATVIHADTVGHEVYRPHSEGWRLVTEAFGTEIVAQDGTIDRQKLGKIVFADSSALERLNAIVHPLISEEIGRRIEAHRAAGSTAPVVVEAAILIEANWLPLVDTVWVVVAPQAAVIDRVQAERQLSPQQIQARIEAQIAEAKRRRYADVVIDNKGDLQELRDQVRAAWARLGNKIQP